MCGERFTFLYTSRYEHVQYNVSGPYVKYFCVKKVFRKKYILRLYSWLRAFGWNNVGPASQMVAQHYFTIRPMYIVLSG